MNYDNWRDDKGFIKVLMDARDFLAFGEYHYVCHCFNRLRVENRITPQDCTKYRCYIMGMLGVYSTYESWVQHEHTKIYLKSVQSGTKAEDARNGRLAWIDWMISEGSK